jgi:hypothetical protein
VVSAKFTTTNALVANMNQKAGRKRQATLETISWIDKLLQLATSAPTSPAVRSPNYHRIGNQTSPTIEVAASGGQARQIRLRACAYFGGRQTKAVMVQNWIFASKSASDRVIRDSPRLGRIAARDRVFERAAQLTDSLRRNLAVIRYKLPTHSTRIPRH